MPSILDLPNIETVRQSFHDAVQGQKDSEEDRHSGSVYDHFAGEAAILWTWEAQRDKDQFSALYFDKCTGQELTDYVLAHDNIGRIADTPGVGTITANRPNVTAGAGTLWKGTKLLLFQNFGNNEYELTADVSANSTQTQINCPIQATFNGRNSKVSVIGNNNLPVAKFSDPLWDNSWIINSINCSAGTTFEEDSDFKARVKLQRRQQRVGYQDIIRTVCSNNGAANIFLLQSNFGGDANDHGINAIYVGDSGFNSTPFLINTITLALESVRVLGADIFLFPITTTNLIFNLTLNLWTDPSQVNSFEIIRSAKASIVNYFNSTTGFSYDLNAIAGDIRKLLPTFVQLVSFNLPVSSQGLLVSGNPPTILTKFFVREGDITITLAGPV